MSNPEFIAQRCDVCDGWLRDREWWGHRSSAYRYEVVEKRRATTFENHSEAHRHARAAGWYIADADLCPTCREKQEVPDGD